MGEEKQLRSGRLIKRVAENRAAKKRIAVFVADQVKKWN
jgi:hypothetical protein